MTDVLLSESKQDSLRIGSELCACQTCIGGVVLTMAGLRRFSIGRDSSCDVVVGAASVSRHHANLILRDDRSIQFEDVGSKNGSYLVEAGRQVRIDSTFLTPEAHLRLGDAKLSLADIMQRIRTKVLQGRRADC